MILPHDKAQGKDVFPWDHHIRHPCLWTCEYIASFTSSPSTKFSPLESHRIQFEWTCLFTKCLHHILHFCTHERIIIICNMCVPGPSPPPRDIYSTNSQIAVEMTLPRNFKCCVSKLVLFAMKYLSLKLIPPPVSV